MNIILTGVGMSLTPALKTHAEQSLEKLDRFVKKDAEISVFMKPHKAGHTCEVSVKTGSMTMRAEETTEDMYHSVEVAVEKVQKRIRKYQEKKNRMEKEAPSIRGDIPLKKEEPTEPQVVKEKTFMLKPMTVEEAGLQMEALGHHFFVFMDAETGETNVIYKRKDGQYGLIAPEIA